MRSGSEQGKIRREPGKELKSFKPQFLDSVEEWGDGVEWL